MKTISFLTGLAIVIILSCNHDHINAQKPDFGVYETISAGELMEGYIPCQR